MFARGESFYNEFCDDPKQKKMESGEGDYSPNSTVCFGYNLRACDVMHIVSVADALQCSVDYLLGRTEDRQSHLSNTMEQNPVSYQGTFLNTDDPDEPGEYILMLQSGGCDPQYEKWKWDGTFWYDWSGRHDPNLDGEIKGWIPIPKLPEKPNPVINASCITGMSSSGQCGAAAHCNKEYTCCLQCPDDSCNGRCGWIDDVAEEI